MKTNQTVESQSKNALSQLEEKAEKETLTEFGATFHYSQGRRVMVAA